MRYKFNHSDFFTDEDGLVGIHHFDDTLEDSEVRIYTLNNEIYDSIKVWYPTTNWEAFKPFKYMLGDSFVEIHKYKTANNLYPKVAA